MRQSVTNAGVGADKPFLDITVGFFLMAVNARAEQG